MVNFNTVACRISSWLKWYKNYKNRLRLAEVIVKNKMSRFFMVHCVVVASTIRTGRWVKFSELHILTSNSSSHFTDSDYFLQPIYGKRNQHLFQIADIKNSNSWYQQLNYWYQESFADIRNSNTDIKNTLLILGIRILDINNWHCWYQELQLLRRCIADISNSISWYQ